MAGGVSGIGGVMDVSQVSYVSAIMNVGLAPGATAINPVLEYHPMREEMSMVKSFRENTSCMATLAEDTAGYLREYSSGMNNMKASAEKVVAGAGLDEGQEDSAGAALAGAVGEMVDQYNAGVSLVRENEGRGAASADRLSVLEEEPELAKTLEEAGIGVNEDGTLTVDEEKLSAVLAGDDAEAGTRLTEALAGEGGLAARIAEAAQEALNTPAHELVARDVEQLVQTAARGQANDPVRSFALGEGGAQAAGSSAMSGLLMNMAV